MNKEKCGFKKLHKGFWLSLCAAVVALVCCVAVFAGVQAADASVLYFESNSAGDGYIVVSCNSDASGELTIPDTHNGKPVVAIGRDAFLDRTGLTSITIPSSVKSIGWYAFSGCTGLTSITIPDSVETMDWFAFANCTNLTTATIGGNCEIGAGAFSGCTALTDVTIQSGITGIGWSAFKGCTKLTSISIPTSVTSVDRYAFYNCTVSKVIYCGTQEQWNAITVDNSGNDSLKNATLQLHNYEDGTCTVCGHSNSPLTFTLNETGDGYIVSDCDAAASGELVIPSTYKGKPVTSIGWSAFKGCTKLTTVTIPNSVTSIGADAFSDCAGLTNITIPDSVTSIGHRAFSNCASLTSITIPNSVTSIGTSAFWYCSVLTNVTIGNGVTSIGEAAFNGCVSLTSLNVEQGNTIYHSTGNCILETATKKLVFGCKTSEIPSDGSVTSIGDGAFACCTGLTGIIIPNSVTSIDTDAFFGCTGLTNITIPDSVTNIDDRAFYECAGLTSIIIPNSVTNIGDHAVYGCTGLTSIIIPDSVTSIGVGVFADCTGLTAITIPNSVKSIGEYAFNGCNNLTDVYYSGNVDQWQQITVEEYNECLLNAKLHAVATTATFGEVKHNLYLEDLTTIGYHCEITPNGTVDKFGILIWTDDPNKEVAVGMEGVQDKELVPNGNLYFAKSDGIYSQYLSVEHYAKPYVKIGAEYIYSPNVDTYTPVAYTESALETENEKLKNTTVSLLNYGTYAQIYFAANKGETVAETDKINKGLTAEQKDFGWNENLQVQPHEVSKNTAQTLNMQWYGTNLSLLDKLQMNMAATGEGIEGMYYWTEEDYNEASVLDATTATGTLIPKVDPHETVTYYIVTIEDIAAKEIGSVFYVCAYDGQGNLGPIRADSVAAYATRLMNSQKPTTTEAAKDLAKALLIYGDSAKKLFENDDQNG